MKIKICGMREKDNVAQIAALSPDYMGFIFHPPSPRDASSFLAQSTLDSLPQSIESVAVFVNEDIRFVLNILSRFGFKHAQLHGTESVEYCSTIKKAGFGVFKVFSIDHATDFAEMEKYTAVADYFLFDTKSPKHGGTGQKFDWDLLNRYKLKKPVLLSGGIGADDAILVKDVATKFPWIHGLDLNSRFEISAGRKDAVKLRTFFEALNGI